MPMLKAITDERSQILKNSAIVDPTLSTVAKSDMRIGISSTVLFFAPAITIGCLKKKADRAYHLIDVEHKICFSQFLYLIRLSIVRETNNAL